MLFLTVLCALWIVPAIQANPSSEEDIQSFLRWFAESGGVTNGVGVAYFEGMGNGISATKDLAA